MGIEVEQKLERILRESMNEGIRYLVVLVIGLVFGTIVSAASIDEENSIDSTSPEAMTDMIRQGKQIFRFDTFGDEDFWGDTLGLHKVIAGKANSGVGPGLSPKTALGVGLKIDVDALPLKLKQDLKNNTIDLNNPAVTLALIKLNSVIGIKGTFSDKGKLVNIGATCAICHSTVDDSFAPGIGHRRDGWPNRDLNIGKIISLSPNLQPIADRLHTNVTTVKKVLNSWGPGKYDAILNMDGKAFRPDGKSAAVLIPAAFGLEGINLHTYTGWGSISYWNAYVANTQLRGNGMFFDPRLNDVDKFPLAVESGDWNLSNKPDMISSKLPALQLYQLSITAPTPPIGSFNVNSANRGKKLFNGKAGCSRCHIPPTYVEPGWSMHKGKEIGIDNFQADRSPDGMYRTTPLKGLFTRMKGGFYHDGRFGTLMDVVNHYNNFFRLRLSLGEKRDLVEFLKSI